MMHCITKCSGLENAAMVLIHTSIVSIVDTSCICKLGTIAHIRSIHISLIAALAARSSYLHLIGQLTDFLSAYSRSFLVLFIPVLEQ